MPIYDYVCLCGREFEARSSVENRKTSECLCGGIAEQHIATCAFHLDPASGDFPTRTRNWTMEKQRENWDDLRSLGLRESKRSIHL